MNSTSKEFTLDPHILHKRLTKANEYIFHLFAGLKARDAEVQGLKHANELLAEEVACLKLEITKSQAREETLRSACVRPALTASPASFCSSCDCSSERIRGRVHWK